MTLPCELILDLLPLYHDGVCSDVSKTLIHGHMKNCSICQNYLNKLTSEIKISEEEKSAVNVLISIQKNWEKGILRACIKGFSMTILIFGILIGGFLALTQWDWIPVSSWNCSVAEIYQLTDGRILYRMDTPEDVWCRSYKFKHQENGSDYKIPVRPLISLGELQGIPSMWGDYQMIDPAENNAWQKAHGHGNPVTEWYWGHPDDAVLIYEEGMALEPAPQELENLFGVPIHPISDTDN